MEAYKREKANEEELTKKLEKASPLYAKLYELGHRMAEDDKGIQGCLICGKQWTLKNRSSIIAEGPCIGYRLAKPLKVPEIDSEPWSSAKGSEVYHKGIKLHRSHHLAYHRGVTYCMICGYFADRKTHKLKLGCTGPPNGQQRKRVRDNLLAGIYPTHGRTWPEEVDSQQDTLATIEWTRQARKQPIPPQDKASQPP